MTELTSVERLALAGLAAGDSYAEIARAIGKSPITVRGAAVRAKKRLGARNITHAVVIWTLARKGDEK